MGGDTRFTTVRTATVVPLPLGFDDLDFEKKLKGALMATNGEGRYDVDVRVGGRAKLIGRVWSIIPRGLGASMFSCHVDAHENLSCEPWESVLTLDHFHAFRHGNRCRRQGTGRHHFQGRQEEVEETPPRGSDKRWWVCCVLLLCVEELIGVFWRR